MTPILADRLAKLSLIGTRTTSVKQTIASNGDDHVLSDLQLRRSLFVLTFVNLAIDRYAAHLLWPRK
jgi:hypothetical protein